MALSKEQKKIIIEKNQRFKGDTGSTEVQIALLDEDIKNSNHLKEHPHDYHSKRGLFIKSRKKQKLLKYLKS
ncbi:30S ribosomal protein S15 [Candidatus Phytoplasma prunorum]|uniref:30S ribosomal protein S15 n=1 Tax=Candidatus Phytoplasma prunorum TaxID=47565 RepID=UPI002FF10114